MKRIVLIDDDKDDGQFFKEVLKEINPSIEFEYYDEGEVALTMLADQNTIKPDIIFLDVNMPLLTGWDCLAKIKQLESLQAVSASCIRHHPIAGTRKWLETLVLWVF